jgi:hypothetical protein
VPVTTDGEVDRFLWAVGEARRRRGVQGPAAASGDVAVPVVTLGPEDFAVEWQVSTRRDPVADAPPAG